jgi:hypothetical protein
MAWSPFFRINQFCEAFPAKTVKPANWDWYHNTFLGSESYVYARRQLPLIVRRPQVAPCKLDCVFGCWNADLRYDAE